MTVAQRRWNARQNRGITVLTRRRLKHADIPPPAPVGSARFFLYVPGEVSPQTDERRVRCGFLYMVLERVR